MKWKEYLDEQEIRKAISILKPNNQLFEIRVLSEDKRKKLSGYFTDTDTLFHAFDNIDVRGCNVYISLNEIHDGCLSRLQSNRFVANAQTTSDSDITRYQWMLVDLDPKRISGTSSTNFELEQAKILCEKVKLFLHQIGFNDGIIALSGNGYHIIYRIDLPNNSDSEKLIKNCLSALADRFNNDHIKIDVVNYNPSRICKLHGTLAQKGTSTKDRPHRMSRIIESSDCKVNSIETLNILAGLIEHKEKTVERNPSENQFDLLKFMSDNGLTYSKTTEATDSIVYMLDECPFDRSHQNGDARIFHYKNGAINFKCHHNSCNQYKWQDVRLKFEPDAYDNDFDNGSKYDSGWNQHKKVNNDVLDVKKPAFESLENAKDILNEDLVPLREYVGVGLEVPFLIEGTCLLSAKSKLGKSWLAMAMCNAISKGMDFLGMKTKQCSTLYLDLETGKNVQQKRLLKLSNSMEGIGDKFYIKRVSPMLGDDFVKQIDMYLTEDPDIGVIVIDVFQKIRKQKKQQENDYEATYRDIEILNNISRKYHVSIILVCHDRKTIDPGDPFSNILGSTALQGATDQMIVMYKDKHDDISTHFSAKGRTMDGLISFDAMIVDGVWTKVDERDIARQQAEQKTQEYFNSQIRKAVLKIVDGEGFWRGRCGDFLNMARTDYHINLDVTPKDLGTFFNKMVGMFPIHDGINLRVTSNGKGSKLYSMERSEENDIL